ncbi:MAG: NTP transferase domain-containing protein, partial [Rickettsiales bacterium]|nr:NTP transferase domain-containing protein [Rickettsiales bacterium]
MKKAVILAAGIGSRLDPITQTTPKSLIMVDGRPILDYQISAYIKSGIRQSNIAIVIGYR